MLHVRNIRSSKETEMRKASFVGAVAMMASLLLATPALAVPSTSENFENFTPGSPLPDDTGTGWTFDGANNVRHR